MSLILLIAATYGCVLPHGRQIDLRPTMLCDDGKRRFVGVRRDRGAPRYYLTNVVA